MIANKAVSLKNLVFLFI